VLLDVGGFHHEKDDPRHDPEANVMFMVRVYCQLCGYVLLFDSEQFRGGDEPVLFMGPPELEEESDPESG
jgi:hypothetical protein